MKISLKVFSAIAFMMLISCSQEDLTYSCNKQVDEWIKEHLTAIHQMTRADWIQIDGSFGVSVYRAFTKEQKLQFWREKFEKVKLLPWAEKEILHIEEAESFVNEHAYYFSDDPLKEDEIEELEVFYYRWSNKAKEELGWTDQISMAIIGTGYDLKNTYGELDLPKTSLSNSVMTLSPETTDCDCSVKVDFCGLYNLICEDTNCETGKGCGVLWLMDCTGKCEW